MFELLINGEVPATGLLMLLGAGAAVTVRGAARSRTVRTLRRRTRRAQAWLVAVAVLALVRGAFALGLLALGWRFGVDRVAVFGPMLALGMFAVALVTWPSLRRARRMVAGRPDDEPVRPALRTALLGRPVAVGPVMLSATGALGAIAALVVVPVPPVFDDLAGYWAALLLLTAALTPGRPRTRRPVVAVRVLAAASVAALVATHLVGAYRGSFLPAVHDMTQHGQHGGAGSPAQAGPGHQGHEGHEGHEGHAGHGQPEAGHGNHPAVPGGPGQSGGHAPQQGGNSVTELVGPRGEPDVRLRLEAAQTPMTLPGGTPVEAWTFNGTLPGPQLTATSGDLVEVVVVNRDVTRGVSVHWHGVDVPNAEDGVPGITQDAVLPGQQHVYRFRAEQVGTFWYHSHQASSEQVRRGLYGSLVITEPGQPTVGDPAGDQPVLDLPVLTHRVDPVGGRDARDQVLLLNDSDRPVTQVVDPGTRVRLRLTVADSRSQVLFVNGTPFRLVATDGNPVHGGASVERQALHIGGGGRRDIEFTMPGGPVTVSDMIDLGWQLTLLPRGGVEAPPPDRTHAWLDLVGYGTPTGDPVVTDESAYDVTRTYYLDNQAGWFDGRFAMLWLMNGRVAPHIEPVTVREGQQVLVRYVNRSRTDHPMHLHGHQVRLVSVDGRPSTGSPIWLDTATVSPGEEVVVAFRADNPGLWMDHCHNLDHAAIGMVNHLLYEGYHTPFRAGPGTPNQPE